MTTFSHVLAIEVVMHLMHDHAYEKKSAPHLDLIILIELPARHNIRKYDYKYAVVILDREI